MRQTISTGGQLPGHRLGAVRVVTHRGSAPYVLKSPDPVGGAHGAIVGVGTQPVGGALLAAQGRQIPCAPGDVFVVDASQPWELRQLHDFRLHLYLVPRNLIGLADQDMRFLWGVHRGTADGVTRLLVPLMNTAAESAPTYPQHIARGVAGGLVDLLGAKATERKSGHSPGSRADQDERTAMARRVRQFVNENLADRDLNPERIAAHHHVSVRYLHKVFAGEGTTLSRWIQQRRLDECRRELARLDGTEPASSFAAVARRWGFVNAAHFSRSFRAAYGVTPSEWRRIRTGTDADASAR
ncbi:helix-turn-helix domain-containing protein [Streptomyces sp. NPDC057798]|uniref:helix-turn-helix domain-containing protein n=1 Tax=Streptomyces sp. NPDC057798 TaxID=3346252 RepID=UPI003693CE13